MLPVKMKDEALVEGYNNALIQQHVDQSMLTAKGSKEKLILVRKSLIVIHCPAQWNCIGFSKDCQSRSIQKAFIQQHEGLTLTESATTWK